MLATEVLKADATRFDMTGQRLPSTLQVVDAVISAGLATRLHAYAERELVAQGFGALAEGAAIKVYTVDGDEKPADRSYCVRWHRPQGGYVEMVGILTKSGWPSLDHGFDIGFEEVAHDA